jgi:outer membrane protein assembly factor BamB
VWNTGWAGSWVESTPAVVDGTAYVGSSDIHELRAVDVADGSVRWAAEVGGWPWSSPAVADGVVYVGSLYRTDKEDGAVSFHAVDAETGEIRWSVGTGPSLAYAPAGDVTTGVVSSPVVSRGAVVFGGLDGVVYAVGVGSA